MKRKCIYHDGMKYVFKGGRYCKVRGSDVRWKGMHNPPTYDCRVVLECMDRSGGDRCFSTGVYYQGKLHDDWSFELVALRYMVLEPFEK